MKINNEFGIGEIVYLKTDTEQLPRCIISLEVYAEGELLYKLNHVNQTSSHYTFEITRDKNILLKLQ